MAASERQEAGGEAGPCGACGRRTPGALFCPYDGAPLAAVAGWTAAEPRMPPGARVGAGSGRRSALVAGRYRLLRRVGQGAMGDVYEAEHAFIQRKVALKLLRREAAGALSEDAVERLRREAWALSTIRDEHVVRVEDFGFTDGGVVYLALEWLEGSTLAERLARGPLPLADALAIARQLCGGLAAAHRVGVVHRDLKPANVFLERTPVGDEVAKILDFGIAKLVTATAALTQGGTLLGTPHYIAPEQAFGGDVDHRADLYALGIVLFEMLTGTVPFDGPVVSVLRGHADEAPQAPGLRAPSRGIPPALDALVLRCLAKQPDGRPASADEVAEQLARIATRRRPPAQIVDDEPDRPHPLDDGARPRARARRGRWFATAALAGVLASGAAAWGWSRAHERHAATATHPGAAETPATNGGAPRPDPTGASDVEWQYTGQAAGFGFTGSLQPSPVRAGEPAALDIVVEAREPHLAAHLRAGELQAHVELLYYKDHRPTHVGEGAIARDGRLLAFDRVTFATDGKYHVRLVLLHDDEHLGEAQFDICVGADPQGDAARLAAVCPDMNPSNPTTTADAR